MIPKIIHHCWPSGGEFKSKFHFYRESFLRFNPDYTFMFWTLDDANLFALSDNSKSFYKNTEFLYVQKSDCMRWEILYTLGGIYVDTDIECLQNLDSFLDNESFTAYSYPPNLIGNAVVGTVPHNPFFKDLSLGAVNSILNAGPCESRKNIEDIGGVNFAGKRLSELKKIYPRETFYPLKWDDPRQRRELRQATANEFPQSACVHWWSGMDPEGWTHHR
jgi:hypothetical protein